jgi:hypothetical protein
MAELGINNILALNTRIFMVMMPWIPWKDTHLHEKNLRPDILQTSQRQTSHPFQ